MFCAHCGTEVLAAAEFCGKCGQPSSTARLASAATPSVATTGTPSIAAPTIYASGFFIGGFIGFLMRPSVMLVGQLPFEMVITRGANLEGLDALLIPAAKESFNGMLAGAIIGLIAAFGVSRLLPKRSS